MFVLQGPDSMEALNTLDIELRRTTIVGVVPDFKKHTGCLASWESMGQDW